MSNFSTESEIAKFDNLAERWWDQKGPHVLLHKLNPLRIDYAIRQIAQLGKQPHHTTILDVGCGGGVFCEGMAQRGYQVTGLDESQASIDVAISHAATQNLPIIYKHGGLHELEGLYDVVVCMEVVEHVEDLESFLQCLIRKVSKNGLLILSTVNRTLFSYIGGIIVAEKIMKIVPEGTHDWRYFRKPHEILKASGLNTSHILDLQGVTLNPLTQEWYLTSSLKGSYFIVIIPSPIFK